MTRRFAYCRALSSSGITDIPASANDLPFLSFLPYAIATAPSFLPFIPFLLSSILVLGATRPGTLAAKAPVPKFRRLIQIVFSIIAAGTAMLLAGLAPGGIYALALNGFGQIGYPDRLLPSTARLPPRPRETSSQPCLSRFLRAEP